jgi:DHA1 family tetracycline resistance protein-like MFS transporter
VIGALSDRFGRRPVILVSTAGLALDWVLMALAPSLWWLVLGRIIGGVTSASGTAIFAYMADITPAEGRTRAFGLVGAAMSAGFVAGPALGGVLGEFGPRLPFWVAAGLSSLAFLYGLFVLPESLRPENRAPFSWARANPVGVMKLLGAKRDLAGLAVSTFLLNFAHRIFTSVFVLYAGHRYGLSTLQVGLLLTVAGGLDLVVQGGLVGPIAARLGERRTMLLGFGSGAVGLLAMALAPSGLAFAAALAPNALWGLAEPTLKSLMSARVSETEQGQLQGAAHSVASVAGIAGPVFFGWIYGMSTLNMPGLSFGVAAAVLLLAALCSQYGGAPVRAPAPQTGASPGE